MCYLDVLASIISHPTPSLIFHNIPNINAEPLLDLTCLQVSCQLMGKSAEEIRVILNIPRLTTEEEAKAREDHRWIFDD